MHKIISLAGLAAILLMAEAGISAQTTSTLRVDCIFSGTDKTQHIFLSELSDAGPWAGRRSNMDKPALKGNGQICLRDKESGRTIYINSFSTLFQEWQNTEEATRTAKSFENVFLVPMPEDKATISITLFDSRGNESSSLTFDVDPSDILIRKDKRPAAPHKYLLKGGDPERCIDLAIVAEGYTADEEEKFYEDAEKAAGHIFSHEPFASLKDKFNVVAVAVPSTESGISIPHDNDWRDTALGSHFDTFYSDRYLTTLKLFRLHDALSGIPYEHIIILANTDNYGGGGIFNSYLMSSARNKWAPEVIVHEFGHSFAGLADEYFYDDQYSDYYYPDVEPWEPNITTLKDFGSKWESMMDADSPRVSKAGQIEHPEKYEPEAAGQFRLGLYEGGGYMSEGVYRAYPQCRMKVNNYPAFCPVCEKAIRDIIAFYTEE